MWPSQRLRFGVRKNNRPIHEVGLGKGAVSTGITYNLSYALWEAAIATGATMDELWRMDQGHYPKEFLAKIIAWYRGKVAIENHTEVAKAKAMKKNG